MGLVLSFGSFIIGISFFLIKYNPSHQIACGHQGRQGGEVRDY